MLSLEQEPGLEVIEICAGPPETGDFCTGQTDACWGNGQRRHDHRPDRRKRKLVKNRLRRIDAPETGQGFDSTPPPICRSAKSRRSGSMITTSTVIPWPR